MKKIFCLFLFIPLFSYCQITLDTLTNNTVYSKIYEIEKSKKEIHQKAIEWIAINFKDANEVVKLNTEDKIIAKGIFNIDVNISSVLNTYPINFIMEISFKDQRYKLEMNSFSIKVGDKDVLLSDHMALFNYENFVDIYIKAKANATYKYEIKFYDKILNDPNKLNEMFEEQKLGSSQFVNNTSDKVQALDIDLFNYISKSANTEW